MQGASQTVFAFYAKRKTVQKRSLTDKKQCHKGTISVPFRPFQFLSVFRITRALQNLSVSQEKKRN